MRALLRLFVAIGLLCIIGACGYGAGYGSAYIRLQPKIERMEEEREAYSKLSDKAVSMSAKSLAFAERYQEVLNTCLTRLYAGPTLEPVVFAAQACRGGIGGPDDVRKVSRLP